VAADVIKRPDLGRIEPSATADLTVVDGRYLGAGEAAITAAGSAAIGKIWDLPEAQAAFNG
jgi:hypothetical protein